MFSFFKKKSPLLKVSVAGKEVCSMSRSELPVERDVRVELKKAGSEVLFEDADGNRLSHRLFDETGQFAFSIRVHPNLACQIDCIFSAEGVPTVERFQAGEARGIRFQPFFLCEARKVEQEIKGHGLFRRGLHFSGTITPSNVSLACVCDVCAKSFRLQSFHAGFSECGYMYSDSGTHTLIISGDTHGVPPAMGKPDLEAVKKLEAVLPKAPDGTAFRYLNPLRCPHCGAAYIDFVKFPNDREDEYYGNYLLGSPPMHYPARQ